MTTATTDPHDTVRAERTFLGKFLGKRVLDAVMRVCILKDQVERIVERNRLRPRDEDL